MRATHECRQRRGRAALQGRVRRTKYKWALALVGAFLRHIASFRRQGILVPFLLLLLSFSATAVEPIQIKIRDLASVEGVRENPLIGYGMIVGLNGTGDKQQTVFAVQTLAGILQRMGVQIPAGAVRVKNVASVFVTANLAPLPARVRNSMSRFPQ